MQVLNLTCNGVNVQRAEDFINTLISAYNEDWVRDKNQIATATSQFINDRLAVIEQELGHVDSDISSYKSEHLIPDLALVSQMYLDQSHEAANQVLELNNQLYMARYIRTFLADERNKGQLLPANSGLGNSTVEKQIADYNTLMLERNSLASNSSESNPLVVDRDNSLEASRNAIISSIDNQINALNAQVRAFRGSESKSRNQIAFVAGLAIPAGILFTMESLNTKVRVRKDIENITAPFLGELPMSGKVRKKGIRARLLSMIGIKPKAGDVERYEILVKEGSRNIVNEAFRVIRSNLEFIIGKNTDHKVIMLTSMNPGSGKTFITSNLAASFAIKGKKVCIVDLDLRKTTISKYVGSPRAGVSGYLNGEIADWHKILMPVGKTHNLSMLPGGSIPPNPSELLYSPNMSRLIDELRKEFDLLFIDCPPTDMVADTSIITPMADLTIFVMRSGVLDRRLVPTIQGFYTDKKFNNMTILLNGIPSKVNGYGYGYGHGKEDA